MFSNPAGFSVMFYSSNNTSISYTVRDLGDIMQTLWLASTCISCLSLSLSKHHAQLVHAHMANTPVVISTASTEWRDDATDSAGSDAEKPKKKKSQLQLILTQFCSAQLRNEDCLASMHYWKLQSAFCNDEGEV